jgi:A/G-specific adenine glycosylase
VSPDKIASFQKYILDYYHEHRRTFAWRQTHNPYHILVSEIMLQQTQTDRVIKKYEAFLLAFPTVEDLARASLRDVLALWQGLGYNRRGMALHKAAQIIVEQHGGCVPSSLDELQALPGIGAYTAGAVCAFAFDKPVAMIETNIRAVFIHFFFVNCESVKDKEIMPVIQQAVYAQDPRMWYYALMDYGVMLKKKVKNPNQRSAHYAVQSKFAGSDRQVRGAIIRLLVGGAVLQQEAICAEIGVEMQRGQKILAQLCAEGFVQEKNGMFRVG